MGLLQKKIPANVAGIVYQAIMPKAKASIFGHRIDREAPARAWKKVDTGFSIKARAGDKP